MPAAKIVTLNQRFTLLLHFHCAYLTGKSEEVNKALCIVVVVKVACGEGGDAFVVQTVRRCGSRLNDIALVKLELYFAGYIFLFFLINACSASRRGVNHFPSYTRLAKRLPISFFIA